MVNWGYAHVALDWAIYKNSTQNSMKMFELMRSRSELNLVDCYGYYDDGWYDLRYSSSHLSRFICDCAYGIQRISLSFELLNFFFFLDERAFDFVKHRL